MKLVQEVTQKHIALQCSDTYITGKIINVLAAVSLKRWLIVKKV